MGEEIQEKLKQIKKWQIVIGSDRLPTCANNQHPQEHWYHSPTEHWTCYCPFCHHYVLLFRNGSQWKVQNPSGYTVAPRNSRDQKPMWGICFSFLCPWILAFQFLSKSVIVSVAPVSCGWPASVQTSLHYSLSCRWLGSTWELPLCRRVIAASCSLEKCWTGVGSKWGWQCCRRGRQPRGGRNR